MESGDDILVSAQIVSCMNENLRIQSNLCLTLLHSERPKLSECNRVKGHLYEKTCLKRSMSHFPKLQF